MYACSAETQHESCDWEVTAAKHIQRAVLWARVEYT